MDSFRNRRWPSIHYRLHTFPSFFHLLNPTYSKRAFRTNMVSPPYVWEVIRRWSNRGLPIVEQENAWSPSSVLLLLRLLGDIYRLLQEALLAIAKKADMSLVLYRRHTMSGNNTDETCSGGGSTAATTVFDVTKKQFYPVGRLPWHPSTWLM